MSFKINAPEARGYVHLKTIGGDETEVTQEVNGSNDFLMSFLELLKTNKTVTIPGTLRIGAGSTPNTITTDKLENYYSRRNYDFLSSSDVVTYDAATRTYTGTVTTSFQYEVGQAGEVVRELGLDMGINPADATTEYVTTRVVLDQNFNVGPTQQLVVVYTIVVKLKLPDTGFNMDISINGVTSTQAVEVRNGDPTFLTTRDLLAHPCSFSAPKIANYAVVGSAGSGFQDYSATTPYLWSVEGDNVVATIKYASGATSASGKSVKTMQLGQRPIMYWLFTPGIPLSTTDSMTIKVTQSLRGISPLFPKE